MAAVWLIPGSGVTVLADGTAQWVIPGSGATTHENQAAAPAGVTVPLTPYKIPLPTHLRM